MLLSAPLIEGSLGPIRCSRFFSGSLVGIGEVEFSGSCESSGSYILGAFGLLNTTWILFYSFFASIMFVESFSNIRSLLCFCSLFALYFILYWDQSQKVETKWICARKLSWCLASSNRHIQRDPCSIYLSSLKVVVSLVSFFLFNLNICVFSICMQTTINRTVEHRTNQSSWFSGVRAGSWFAIFLSLRIACQVLNAIGFRHIPVVFHLVIIIVLLLGLGKTIRCLPFAMHKTNQFVSCVFGSCIGGVIASMIG